MSVALPLLTLAVLHLLGSVIHALAVRQPLRRALRSPSSLWASMALLSAVSLGLAGAAVLITMALAAAWLRRQPLSDETVERRLPLMLAGVALVIFARPYVPTQWDEFVWLAKARFEAFGFGSVVTASLDPSLNIIPPGYPALWPSMVGWLALGRDSLDAQVVAASMLVLACMASALEGVLRLGSSPRWSWLVVLAVPFVWVHARSVYVDLPVGLLSLGLAAQLVTAPKHVSLSAVTMAVVLAGLKDEGLAHVAAVTLSVALVRRSKAPLFALVAAATMVLTWRLLVQQHGVVVFDHSLDGLHSSWLPRLAQLLVWHAADVPTWGAFWVIALVCSTGARRTPESTALALAALGALVLLCGAILTGPERVRVFAENGTLLNRLLVQLWPLASSLILLRFSSPKPEFG